MKISTTKMAVMVPALSVSCVFAARGDTAPLLQDYTSGISMTVIERGTIYQQAGSYLGAPVLDSGGSNLRQGMFGIISGFDGTVSGIDMEMSDAVSPELAYDRASNSIRMTLPDDCGRGVVTLSDVAGATIFSGSVAGGVNELSLPALVSGVYIVRLITDNNSIRTVKFVIR